MSAPDLVAAAIERLRAEVAELQGRVSGAAELQALIARSALPVRTPAAFVVPLGDDAEPPAAATGIVRQRLAETVGVVLVDRVAGEPTGERARRDLTELREAVRAALVGWLPPGAAEPFEWRRSRAFAGEAAAVFLQCELVARWHHRQPSP